jgi:uncharacterized repeat protein (TIGR01451 family)
MAVTASGPSLVTAGTNATYTLTLTNNGPNAAQGVVLSDTLPAGSTFVSMTQTAGSDAFTFAQSGGSVSESATASVASGSSDTFSLVVFAPSSLANGASFNDTATVSASNPDPNPANNTATVTGTVVNNNPNADLGVTVSGPASGSEGGTVTYNITVTNAGPSSASATILTDTLGSILNFQSATTSQGTFAVVGGVVTFSLGTVASGGTVTASVTAQAVEDGNTSDAASVTSSSPDPNTANNNASATTSFTEPAISVSGAINTRSRTLTNFQVATFTHASAVEPASAFSATINWGDNTTSAGVITLSAGTYHVTGSHTYAGGSRHTIRTTVVETGSSPNGGDKVGDERPGDDIVRLRRDPQADDSAQQAVGSGVAGSGGADSTSFVVSAALPGQDDTGASNAGSPAAQATDQFFSLSDVVVYPLGHKHSPSDWFADSWLSDFGQ